MGHAFARATIDQSQISIRERFGRECIIVEIKSASEAPTAVEDEGADHRSRGVPLLLKRLRDRAKARLQRLASEILHSILEGIQASQNHCVRRPSQRHLRDGPFKNNAIARESIESRCLDVLCPITTQMVGADRINGDEDYVRPGFGRGRRGCRERLSKRRHNA